MSPIDEIPTDLADAVRHAAAAVPAGQHSLGAVHRRRRRHQRRRTAAVAGVATVAVAAGAVGVPVLVNSSDGPAPGPAASGASATASPAAATAQRLLITSGYMMLEGPGGNTGVSGPAGVLEVDAAGKIVAHPVTGMDSADWTAALPDGRIVMLGPKNLKPGVQRPDGPDVTDLEFRLACGDYNANVRLQGEQVRLIGATAEGAYLLRSGRRLVFHEFRTGTERPLDVATAALAAAGDPVHMYSAFVQDNYLVFHRVGEGIFIIDITTGAQVVIPIEVAGDYGVDEVQLSPDGRTVMIVIAQLIDPLEFRLISLDVATRRAVKTQTLPIPTARSKSRGVLGSAFTDNRTVRVAWYAFPADANRVYDISELLKVSTFTV